MKNYRRISAVLAMVLCFTMMFSSVALAKDQTYLALGDDLSAKQMTTVLGIFGVADVNDCEVIYVTNKDEHKYLDDYVDAAQIGNQALSCVMINETDDDDIEIELHNINYCTEDMYKNALETAGVKGAEVVVAGPYPISGTAALVGTIKAYEKMAGTRVSDKIVEAAVDEMTTTGEIGEEVGDKDGVAEIIDEVKEKLAENPDMSESQIISAIKAAADEVGISLSDENVQKIKDVITKLKGLDIDWAGLFNKAKEIGQKGYDAAKKVGLFEKIKEWLIELFR